MFGDPLHLAQITSGAEGPASPRQDNCAGAALVRFGKRAREIDGHLNS